MSKNKDKNEKKNTKNTQKQDPSKETKDTSVTKGKGKGKGKPKFDKPKKDQGKPANPEGSGSAQGKSEEEKKPDYSNIIGEKSHNDVKWYVSDPNLLSATCSIPTRQVVGTSRDINGITMDAIPGIMSVHILHGVGVSRDFNSAVNVAARSLYTALRKVNSSNYKLYETPDAMLLVYGVCEAYIPWMIARRLYAVAVRTSAINRYVPEGLIEAMGFDPVEVRTRLNDVRNFVVQYARRLERFPVPSMFPFLSRMEYLYCNVHKDEDSGKSQYYVPMPRLIRKWDGFQETGSTLIPAMSFIEDGEPKRWSLDEFFSAAYELTDILNADTDASIIFGDLVRAFDEDMFIHPTTISEDYTIDPLLDSDFCKQLQNADILPDVDVASATIGQSSRQSAILYNPIFGLQNNGLANAYVGNKMLNFYQKEIKPEDIAEATRFSARSGKNLRSGSDALPGIGFQCTTMADCVITFMTVYKRTGAGFDFFPINGGNVLLISEGFSASEIETRLAFWLAQNPFKWHPNGHVFYWPTAQNPVMHADSPSLIDDANYVIASYDDLDNINKMALINEFAVDDLVFRAKKH